ncbi:MAG TPA: beta-eliminating lyase-related protein [Ilumatobacteraceae bacterium]|nr:beta-eliminating lyase-related protein [Ilumatobacteraceae bacterium]
MSTSSNEPIELRSDNAAGVAPEILAAIAAANEGSALAYGGDALTAQLRDLVRDIFGQPQAEVFPVVSGTAANSLALSAMLPPWGSVLCHETAHIFTNEGGATSLFSGGAVMRGLAGSDYKLHPASVQHAFDTTLWGDGHHSQPSVVSITCPTDFGTVYAPAEVSALAALAHSRGLRMHLDGARLANALVAVDGTPVELITDAGVDAFSLGATKNGALSTDAIVCFDSAASEQLIFRLKRSGHVASKMRYQSAQLVAYLTDDLWLRLAARANEAMAALSLGLDEMGVELLSLPPANMLFARVGDPTAAALAEVGLLFYEMGGGVIRFVTSFQTTHDDVLEVLRRVEGVIRPRGAVPSAHE